MYKKYKKSQLAIFIIVGLIIVLMSFVLIKTSSDDKVKDLSFEGSLDSASVDEYAISCIESLVKEGIGKVGYKDYYLLEDYITDNLLECVEYSNNIFLDMNINGTEIETNIDFSNNNDTMFVNVNFPIVVEKDGMFFSLEEFEFSLPIKLREKLDIVDDVLQKTVIINSPDSKLKMKIEKGTRITNQYGYEFDEIWMDIRDKKDYYIYDDNSIFEVVYEMLPHGAEFNPPITLTFKYDDSMIDSSKENLLTWSFYNPKKAAWIPYDITSVDTNKNIISAKVNHFSGESATTGKSIEKGSGITICDGLSQNECGAATGSIVDGGITKNHCNWEDGKCKPSCGEWLFANGFSKNDGYCLTPSFPDFNLITCEKKKCNITKNLATWLKVNISSVNGSEITFTGTDNATYSSNILDPNSGKEYGCDICLGGGPSNGEDEIDLNSVIWSGSDVAGLPIVSGLEVNKIDVGEPGMEYAQSMLVDKEMGLIYFFWEASGQWYGKSIEHIGAERPWNVARGLHYVGENNDAGPLPSGWKVCDNSPWRDGSDNVAVPPVGEEVYYLVVNENPEKQERTAVKSFTVYVENKCATPVEIPDDADDDGSDGEKITSLNNLIFLNDDVDNVYRADLIFQFLELFKIKNGDEALDFNISFIESANPNCDVELGLMMEKKIILSKNEEKFIEIYYDSDANIDPYCIYEGEIFFQNNKNLSDTLTKTFKINFTDSKIYLSDIKFSNDNEKNMFFQLGFNGKIGEINLYNDGLHKLIFETELSKYTSDDCKLNLDLNRNEYTINPDEHFKIEITANPEENQICTLETNLSFIADGVVQTYNLEITSED